MVPGPTAWCQITHPGGEWLIGPRQRGVAAFRPDGYADDLLPFVHVAEFSAAGLDDQDCAELARWAAARGPAYVLVTRGSKGAMLFDGGVIVSVSAVPSSVVDTLGAGDSFIGRALLGLIRGEPAQVLLAASARAAARTCSAWGAYGHGVHVSTFKGWGVGSLRL
jgi:fructoselysine 6-kinase